MPRSRDLAIFVVTTDGQMDRQTDYFTPTHVCGVITHTMGNGKDNPINVLCAIVYCTFSKCLHIIPIQTL